MIHSVVAGFLVVLHYHGTVDAVVQEKCLMKEAYLKEGKVAEMMFLVA